MLVFGVADTTYLFTPDGGSLAVVDGKFETKIDLIKFVDQQEQSLSWGTEAKWAMVASVIAQTARFCSLFLINLKPDFTYSIR